jgi:ribonuclease HII
LVVSMTTTLEESLRGSGEVVGVDEVGRGALAGPVVVGAVRLPRGSAPPSGLDDSKALTAARRRALVDPLRRWTPGWALGAASPAEIDLWGMRLALGVALERALDALEVRPAHVVIDGNLNLLDPGPRLDLEGVPLGRYRDLAVTTVVGGDRRCATVAAAAVLAKVTRDDLMCELAGRYPDYGWERNKGYGTPDHLAALRRSGPCALHRRSWNLPSN